MFQLCVRVCWSSLLQFLQFFCYHCFAKKKSTYSLEQNMSKGWKCWLKIQTCSVITQKQQHLHEIKVNQVFFSHTKHFFFSFLLPRFGGCSTCMAFCAHHKTNNTTTAWKDQIYVLKLYGERPMDSCIVKQLHGKFMNKIFIKKREQVEKCVVCSLCSFSFQSLYAANSRGIALLSREWYYTSRHSTGMCIVGNDRQLGTG
jgi:hypothetical protein